MTILFSSILTLLPCTRRRQMPISKLLLSVSPLFSTGCILCSKIDHTVKMSIFPAANPPQWIPSQKSNCIVHMRVFPCRYRTLLAGPEQSMLCRPPATRKWRFWHFSNWPAQREICILVRSSLGRIQSWPFSSVSYPSFSNLPWHYRPRDSFYCLRANDLLKLCFVGSAYRATYR